jgi:hypothetical protein
MLREAKPMEARMLRLVTERDEVAKRVDEIDAEILAETVRLRALNDADADIPLEELAAMAERNIERNTWLVANGVIPRELLDDAVRRHRRIRAMMNGERG